MYPKVNQNILIELMDEKLSAKSIVADVEEKEILISLPIDGKIIGLLYVGVRIHVTFHSGENKYIFDTEIIGRKKDKIPLFQIKKPQLNEIIRIQQRENFRMNTNLKLKLNDVELLTINLSAGGVLISCRNDLQLQNGDMVSGTLFIPNSTTKEIETISFKGSIRRIDVFENQNRKNIAIQFQEILERDQNIIIQHCFDKQRQNRLRER